MKLIYLPIWLLIFFAGASIFSFLGVVAYRLPRKIQFVKGRSMCDKCGHTLNGVELIPVFGWFILKGKCRHCGVKVPFRYTLTEIIGGALTVGLSAYYGLENAIMILPAFILFCFLMLVTLVDTDTMEIPDSFVIGIAVTAVIAYFVRFPGNDVTIIERLIGLVSVSVPMLLIALIIKGAFGGGDIKLCAAVGLCLGWKLTVIGFAFAVLFGGLYGIFVLITKKLGRKDHFAFGPFLCAGFVFAVFGEKLVLSLVDWYIGLL